MKIIKASIFSLIFISCQDYTPRPKGYPRIDFPKKEYKKAQTVTCPFAFQIPKYTNLSVMDKTDAEPCWYNLNFVPFNATLHLSYKNISPEKSIEAYIEDTRELVFKHTVKAEEIEEREINNHKDVKGIFYDIKGETATSINFFVSDYQHHFLRGAFYFNSKTRIDSVQPVVDFVKRDLIHLIKTLSWE